VTPAAAAIHIAEVISTANTAWSTGDRVAVQHQWVHVTLRRAEAGRIVGAANGTDGGSSRTSVPAYLLPIDR
jgi:hypothetical protein